MINAKQLTAHFKLNFQQASNVQGILIECERQQVTDVRQIAYTLATVQHECAGKWAPIKEWGGRNYFIRMYWEVKRVARWLGNDNAADAAKYFGRGYSMITGESHYETFEKLLNIPLTKNPDLALQPEVAAKILVLGMKKGIFAPGHYLDKYFTKTGSQPLSARRIINGSDKMELVGQYYKDILELIS